jgi:hypothetical protein
MERANGWERINFLNRVEKQPRILPIIITCLEAGITKENGARIVSISKFNTFLLKIDKYMR